MGASAKIETFVTTEGPSATKLELEWKEGLLWVFGPGMKRPKQIPSANIMYMEFAGAEEKPAKTK